MARRARSSKLEHRSTRLELPVAKKPVWVRIGPKLGLGYRRNQTAGSWVLRVADGRGGYEKMMPLGLADDFEDADGTRVLTFWQAEDKARTVARSRDGRDWVKPATVGEALDAYEADLKTRSSDVGNVTRLRAHLPTGGLCDKPVALLVAADLLRWRDGLVRAPAKTKSSVKAMAKHRRARSTSLSAATEQRTSSAKREALSRSTINRTCTVLKAALNFAAGRDERITNRRAWEAGLATIPDAEQSRNVILDDAAVRSIIAAAQALSPEFGLLIDVAAVTGARASQLARLEVRDLQADRTDPRLQMPASRKGKGVKKIMRHPVPIPAGLAAKLQAVTKDRSATAPLLLKPTGDRWRKSDHARLFRRAATAADQDPAVVTMYALRHSSIVRLILAGKPIRVVAVIHDTSVAMIERNYSREIGDHSDVVVRDALLDTDAPPAGANVVPMRAGTAPARVPK